MQLAPSLADAIKYTQAGDNVSAERILRRIVDADPCNAEAWCHLGTCCLFQGRARDAIESFEQAVTLRGDFPEALNNMGVALARANHFQEAIARLTQASLLRAAWAEPCINLGNVSKTLDRFDAVVSAYEDAVRREPENFEAHDLLAGALAMQGLHAQAKRHFVESIRLQPRYASAHSNLLLALNYDPTMSPSALLVEHEWWDRLHGCGLENPPEHSNNPDPDRGLRVGFVSPDLRAHAVAKFVLPIFFHHNRERMQIFAYAEVSNPDTTSERLRSRVAGWRSTCGQTDSQVAEMVRQDKIDILIDLAGHTAGNRLGMFSRRPAPVQVTYLGYPSTTGVSGITYRLTDAIADPADNKTYDTEELVRLPGAWCCYEPPADAPDGASCGDGHGPVIFGSTHNLAKLNDDVLKLWVELLRRVPEARFFAFRNTLDGHAKRRLTSFFCDQGIQSDRLELCCGSVVPPAYLRVYNKFDILLDTFPWSSHVTACESVWMGVPIVTMRGSRHAGRMCASILTTLGLKELIAETPNQYVDIASRLAADRGHLLELRNTLRDTMRRSAVCDARAFVNGFEDVLRDLWCRWCRGGEGKRRSSRNAQKRERRMRRSG